MIFATGLQVGRLGDWEIGRLGDWGIGRLGDWGIGRLVVWFLGWGNHLCLIILAIPVNAQMSAAIWFKFWKRL